MRVKKTRLVASSISPFKFPKVELFLAMAHFSTHTQEIDGLARMDWLVAKRTNFAEPQFACESKFFSVGK